MSRAAKGLNEHVKTNGRQKTEKHQVAEREARREKTAHTHTDVMPPSRRKAETRQVQGDDWCVCVERTGLKEERRKDWMEDNKGGKEQGIKSLCLG